MMPSQLGIHFVDPTHSTYANDALFNDASRHAVNTHARRLSRGSKSQRSMPAMRVTKPSSANNSPQSAVLQARRRAVVAEGLHRVQQPMYDSHYLPTPGPECYDASLDEFGPRSTRPASWHSCCPQVPHAPCCLPGTVYQPQAIPYALPKYFEADLYAHYLDMPPTPAAYSAFASPASALSPLSPPTTNAESWPAESLSMFPSVPWPQTSRAMPPVPALDPPSAGSSTSAGPNLSLRVPTSSRTSSSADWASFSAQAFDRYAMPPTPENMAPQTLSQANVKVEPEEPLRFRPLGVEDDETDGEVLYGMGLYDAPERHAVAHDPWRTCRSSVMPLPAGVEEPAPRGRGLKLEDSWDPPVSDEEEGNNESGDES